MNWFEQAIADIGNAIEEAAQDVVDFVEDVVEDVVEAVGEVIEDVGEVLEDVGGAIVEAAEDVGEALGDAAEWTMNALDDTVFDTVDYLTGGAIDIDYDNGQFSAGLDFGIASVGVSVGEQGFSADASFDIGLARGEISYDPADGLAASGSIGVDWGPLPYAEGHLTIGTDGSVSIGGEFQASLPLPFGEIDFATSGGFERNPDGSWGAYSDTELNVDSAFGDVRLATDSSLSGDASGVQFESNFEAEAEGMFGSRAGVQAGIAGGVTDGVASVAADIDADIALLGAEARAGGSFDASLGIDGSHEIAAEVRGGVGAGDLDLDATIGASHSVDSGGVITDVVTGEVIGSSSSGTVTVGGTVGATHGTAPPSIDADGWVDVVGDAGLPVEPAPSSRSDALLPEAGAEVGGDAPASQQMVDDAFADAGFVDPGVGEPLDLGMAAVVEPAPAPLDDFSQDLAEVAVVEEQADDLWDDLNP